MFVLVVVLSCLLLSSTNGQDPSADGEYVCGNQGILIKFPASPNANLTYQQLFVDGFSGDTDCATASVNNGIFELDIDDLAACNVTANAAGEANVIVNLQTYIGFDNAEDGYVNLTCNVNGEPVSHTLNAELDVIRGEHKQLDVERSEPPQAEITFEKNGQTVIEAILGDRLSLCVEADFADNEYASLNIIDATTTNDKNLIDEGCKSDDVPGADVGFPTTTTSGHVCFDFQTFRFHGATTASFTVKIEYYTDVKNQANGNTCSSTGRRKRSADQDKHVTRTLSVYLPLLEVERGSAPSPKQNVPENYVDSEMFYVVVAVLAVLLVMAISVAAFFANRARIVHVTNDKLNL